MNDITELSDFLKSNDSKAIYKKKEYAKNRWQHEAVVYAEDLNIKINNGWFKFFKMYFDKHEPLFISIKEYMNYKNVNSDRYFYAVFHNRRNNAPR